MNQLYEVIKPVRVKPLNKKERIDFFIENRPGSVVGILSMGYIILFGLLLGLGLTTAPLH